ncbi:MAG: DUF1499 domain-containing protein [Planctomycetota bacterium]
MRNVLLVLAAALVLGLTSVVLLSQRPGPIGLVGGALAPCTGGSCVNSQIGPPEHRVEPLYVGPEVDRAWQALQRRTAEDGRLRLGRVEGDWMHLEWRPAGPLWVDDIEVLRMHAGGVLHVRATSRVGAANFGSHRRAVEELRRGLVEATAR